MTRNFRIDDATAIKVAAVLVAMPRWIGALLEADGAPLLLTDDTRYVWGLFSAFASVGMALVEGFAFWYTLRAWRKSSDGVLLALIVASMGAFAVVLTPYIMANVSGATLASILRDGWLIAWSSCVSLSTILIVASVGYAQPKDAQTQAEQSAQPAQVGASVPLVQTPAVLVPHVSQKVETQAQPLRPLDRLDVIKFWQAHTARSGNGFADVADIAHETLNGRSANLAAWYDGKQSIASLAEALGADKELTKKIGGWVRFGAKSNSQN